MSNEDKWYAAVGRLTKLTKDGELAWRAATSVESNQVPEDLVGLIYVAKQGNNLLRLYKVRMLQDRFGVFPSGSIIAALPLPRRRADLEWVEKVILEMIDDYGNIRFTFPQISGLKDLYESVSYQAAGVRDFLEELLETKK
jgi:hypothetical protein